MNVLRLLIPFILLVSAQAYAQDKPSLNTLIENNQKIVEEIPTEKVYLHFDKPYYALGDTIWFKAYLATGQNNPSDLSKVMYVDVISESDSLLRSMRLPVVNTSSYGSLVLDPQIYRSGNYRFRAYSYWMMNWGDDYFFNKTIPVGNAINRKVITNVGLVPGMGTSPTINASIEFKDPDGTPYANSKLNWNLVSKFETIERGKAVTDAQGRVSLVLSAKDRASLDTGILETILETEQSLISSNFPLKNTFADADIQFFPEGGDMIRDLAGKIAFKAIQEKGMGVAVAGDIVDHNGKVVTSFKSQKFGMGSFSFLPQTGTNYKANVKFSNGINRTYDLPEVKEQGISISTTNNTAEHINFRISSNQTYFSSHQNNDYYIVARNKGVVYYAAQLKLTSPVISAAIPKEKFPEGIVQLTLFSNAFEPLTERLAFIHRPSALDITVSTDKKTYGSRQPVKMSITAATSQKPIQGNFSLSVVSEKNVPFQEDDEITILSSFLLSSELAGYVEKPNYYFNGINEQKLSELDILMMTQGYRRYSYSETFSGTGPKISFMPEQGITFSGTLRSSNGMPVSKGSLRISVPQSRYYAEVSTNVKGEFQFDNVNLTDSSEVTITARSAAGDDNMMILLDGTAYAALDKDINSPNRIMNIDSLLNPYLLNSKRQYLLSTQMLQEVVVTASATPKASHRDYSALSGLSAIPDHLIDGDRLKGCGILINCLQTAAMGLTFSEQQFFVSRAFNSGNRTPVSIFVNGMNVDVSYLNSIDSRDVESIEIFLRDELGLVDRANNTNGVLAINTRKAPVGTKISAEELRKLIPPKNTLRFTPLGYVKTKEFYSPKYLTPASRTTGSDLRTTIYWNPKIFTDEQGKMGVEFYNGDNKGSYKAIVEGTDIDGNLARTIYKYTVQ